MNIEIISNIYKNLFVFKHTINSIMLHNKKFSDIISSSVIYFIIVFGLGFILGIIRISLILPYLGERFSELLEAPIMLIAIFIAARFTIRNFGRSLSSLSLLIVGCIALCLLLMIEFTVVLSIRGNSLSDYLYSRDPVSGTVYVISLGIFAIMPLVLSIHPGRER